MTERPTTVEEWEAAVREIADGYGATPYERVECVFVADRLRALLPPAKERVPWWEAKGRTIDGTAVVECSNGQRGPGVFADKTSLSMRWVRADADGRVEVDAR